MNRCYAFKRMLEAYRVHVLHGVVIYYRHAHAGEENPDEPSKSHDLQKVYPQFSLGGYYIKILMLLMLYV